MPPPLSDIRHDRRRLLAERPLQRRRELRVVLVATREDAALGDIPGRYLSSSVSGSAVTLSRLAS